MKIELENAVVYQGSNLDVLPTLPDNSVDSIVTDPPYELGFMGKKWDNSGIAYSVELWTECMRVLKPGGHLLAFGGSRTWHRLAVAIEDAGFEMRDSIAWLYGSGFPKSMDISKQIDKQAGAEREVLTETVVDIFGEQEIEKKLANPGSTNNRLAMGDGWQSSPVETAPATPEAKQWQGWGTALKPAFEPVVVARKPLEEKTVAANVMKYGTGGLNIDGSRIGSETITTTNGKGFAGSFEGGTNDNGGNTHTGRWPANIILDPYTAELLDEQSGISKPKPERTGIRGGKLIHDGGWNKQSIGTWLADPGGGASRFFYVADTQKHDRISVCENTPANNVANYFKTIRAIIENSAQTNVEDLPNEQLDQTVKSAGILCDLCVTSIAHDLVALKFLATNKATSTHFQRYTNDCVNSTLTQNLVSLVETWANTDTIPTTTNFGILFGCVLLAIDENTRLENLKNDKDQTPFLYQAKASKKDRNEGLDELEPQRHADRELADGVGGDNPRNRSNTAKQNFHPTVKPTSLMEYLIRLVTPPNGTVLDPFTGSGSTGKAALLNDFQFIGIELTEEYLPIIQGRLNWANEQASKQKEETLF